MSYSEKVTALRVQRQSAFPLALLLQACLAIVSALIFMALFLRIMNFDLRKDEELYVPPISLLGRYEIYRDFFYNHPPGSAWWFHWTARLIGSDHLLLSGRLSVFMAWLLLAAAVGAVSYAFTRSGLVSWCIAVLSLANPLLMLQTGVTATNNLLPLPFSFLGLGLFLLAVRDGRARPLQVAVAGVCLSLAVCLKLNAVSFIPPVAIAAFLLPSSFTVKERLLRVVAPLAIGGLIGALPVLVYLLSDPALFLAHVVKYHIGPHLAYWRSPGVEAEDAVMSTGAKLVLAHGIWLSAAGAVGLAVLLALVLAGFRQSGDDRPQRAPGWIGAVVVVLGAFACSVVLSFVPTPSFPQYFAPPLICLPLGLALLFAALGPRAQQAMRAVFFAAAIVVLAVISPYLGQFLARAAHPGQWAVMQVHEAGVTIKQRMAAAGVQGKVATLLPVYPLEGGLDVYLELATGPFAYRTGDLTPPDLAAFYRMTSPTKIDALLESDPPAALLLGFQQDLERPMLAYAQRHGYVAVTDLGFKDRYGVPVLYLKPAPASVTPASQRLWLSRCPTAG